MKLINGNHAGVDGYTIEPCEKDTVGTDIILTCKRKY